MRRIEAISPAFANRAGDPREIKSALRTIANPFNRPASQWSKLLIEGGFAVSPSTKQVDRFHDRYTTAGAKDDDRDARAGCRPAHRPAAFHRVTPNCQSSLSAPWIREKKPTQPGACAAVTVTFEPTRIQVVFYVRQAARCG